MSEDSQVPLQAELQARIGLMPKVHVRQLEDSEGTVLYSQVSSLSEITRLVRASRTLGLRVRAGAGADCLIADDFDVIADTDFIADEERIVASQRSGQQLVTVKPGVTVREFNEFCLSQDLCLGACPDMPTAKVVDLATTGCSGHSPSQPAVSDFLDEIRIVDADGRLRSYRNLSDEDFDAANVDERRREEKRRLFAGAQCHLGLFGVVYDATFRVEKNFTVRITTDFRPLEDVLLNGEALQQLAADNQSAAIYWFPFNSVRGPQDPAPQTEEEVLQEELQEQQHEGEEDQEQVEEEEEQQQVEEGEEEQQQVEEEEEGQQQVEEEEEGETQEEQEEEVASRSSPVAPTPPPELYEMSEWTANRDEVFCRFMNRSQTLSQPKTEFDLISPEFLDFNSGQLDVSGEAVVDMLRSTHRRHRQQQPSHSELHQHASWGNNWVRAETYPSKLSTVEYALDAGSGFSATVDSVERVAKRVDEYRRRDQFPLNCCLCVSFSRASSALLAPSHCAHSATGGSGVNCSLRVLLFPGQSGSSERQAYRDFVEDLEMDLRGVRGARPHWATNWAFVDGTHAMLRKVYEQDLETFKTMIRDKLVDLDGVFLNRHLAQIVDSDSFGFQQRYALKNKKTKDTLAAAAAAEA